jgi:predicted transcriptional regulator
MNPQIAELRARRIALGITQRELAERAQLSKVLVEKLETGKHLNPTLNTLESLKSALNRLEQERAAESADQRQSA